MRDKLKLLQTKQNCKRIYVPLPLTNSPPPAIKTRRSATSLLYSRFQCRNATLLPTNSLFTLTIVSKIYASGIQKHYRLTIVIPKQGSWVSLKFKSLTNNKSECDTSFRTCQMSIYKYSCFKKSRRKKCARHNSAS